MSNDLRDIIYNNLNLKETDELLEIWQTNDNVAWDGLTFDLIREILLERSVALPPQDDPIYEYDEDDEGEDEIDDEESEPVFYNPRDVERLELWLNRLAIIMVVVVILFNLFLIPSTYGWIAAYYLNNWVWNIIAGLLTLLYQALSITVQSVIYYFGLKAVASILKILMTMEFHSRAAGESK